MEAQSQPAKRQRAFQIAVNLVMVNVSVTDPSGKWRPDLTRDDFEVLEDGVKQEVRFFYAAQAPFHVALLVDTSSSTASKRDLIRKAAERFLRRLTPEDSVALIDVGGSVRVLQDFTSDRALLSKQLRRLGATKENGTLLYDGILRVLQELFVGLEGRKAAVFLTDGQDAGSRTDIEELRAAVHSNDSVLYGLLVDTVGGKSAEEREKALKEFDPSIPGEALAKLPVEFQKRREQLTALCDHSGGRSYELVDVSEVDEFYRQVAEELTRTYSLGYYSKAAGGSYHSLEVKLVGRGGVNIRARRGFVLR